MTFRHSTLWIGMLGLLAGGALSTASHGQMAAPPSPAPASSITEPPSAVPGPRPVAARIVNARSWREQLGLSPEYDRVAGVENLKVAVLDYGFDGMDRGLAYLPSSAVVVEHYDPAFVARHPDLGNPEFRRPFEPGNRHGRQMAQIVWSVTGSNPRGPRFFLLNANGPTMLRRAVRYAIEQKVDIILFSGSFEGGGNGDGRGFINGIIDEAIAAGILWVNAAGNHGHLVHNGPVRILPEGYLRLGGGTDIAALRFRNRLDENVVTVTLTWNDYRATEDAGTTKDLDLYVEDWTGRRVGASELVQIAGDRAAGEGESRNPRERVILTGLPASPHVPSDPDCAYRIRIKAKAGTFTAEDRIRVLVTAQRDAYIPPGGNEPVEAIEFLDRSREGELYPPADHPLVLTVGVDDRSSSIGPTADRRVKPDVILTDARADFSDGTVTAGSSNAAAYFAGIVAVLKAAEPGLTNRHLLELARRGGRSTSTSTSTATNSASTSGTRASGAWPPSTTTAPRITRVGSAPGQATRGTATNLTATTPRPPEPDPTVNQARSPRSDLPEHLERRRWSTPTRAELRAAVR